MELSQRKKDILFSVIEDYIKDASPITSGAVKSKNITNVSSATLRNELNALEAMGFLRQLHTSGGRVPTSYGYRFYVDELLKDLKLEESKIDAVRGVLTERTKSVNEIVSELAKIVSEATNYPTVVMMNGYDNLLLEEIKIIPLIAENALVLMKTSGGIINNTLSISASNKACEDAGLALTKKFSGKTIKEMIDGFAEFQKALVGELKDYGNLVENLLSSVKEILQRRSMAVRQAGVTKLLSDGSAENVKGTKKLLSILENEEEITQLFNSNEDDISVDVRDVEGESVGYSVVKAPIMVGGKNIGSIGVVGPQRMDYSLIASAVKFVASEIENLGKLEDKK